MTWEPVAFTRRLLEIHLLWIQPRIRAYFDMRVLPRTLICEWKLYYESKLALKVVNFSCHWSIKEKPENHPIHSFVHSLIYSFKRSSLITYSVLDRVLHSRNRKTEKMMPALREPPFQGTICRRGISFGVQFLNPTQRLWTESESSYKWRWPWTAPSPTHTRIWTQGLHTQTFSDWVTVGWIILVMSK